MLSLLSIGPGIHMQSHILGRFKQEYHVSTDYYWIVMLEVIPGFQKENKTIIWFTFHCFQFIKIFYVKLQNEFTGNHIFITVPWRAAAIDYFNNRVIG